MAASRSERISVLTRGPPHHEPVEIDGYGQLISPENTRFLPVHYAWGEGDRQRMNDRLRSRSTSVTSDYSTDTDTDDGVGPADGWTETSIDDLPGGVVEGIRLGLCPDCRRRNIDCYCHEPPIRDDVGVLASSQFLVMNFHSTISKDRTAGEEARHADLLAHLGKKTRNCIADDPPSDAQTSLEDNMDIQDSKHKSEKEEVVTRILQCRPGAWYDILGLEEAKKPYTYNRVQCAFIRLCKKLRPRKGDMDVSDGVRQAQGQVGRAFEMVKGELFRMDQEEGTRDTEKYRLSAEYDSSDSEWARNIVD